MLLIGSAYLQGLESQYPVLPWHTHQSHYISFDIASRTPLNMYYYFFYQTQHISEFQSFDFLFLLYMINSNSINSLILENVQGIGRTRTSLGKLKELLVPIPPFPEQKQIVKRIQKFYSFVKYIECSIE